MTTPQTEPTPRTDAVMAEAAETYPVGGPDRDYLLLQRTCLEAEKLEILARDLERESARQRIELENERQKVAGCSTAAFGYWKEGDGLHPDYECAAIHDTAAIYAKYVQAEESRERYKAIFDKYYSLQTGDVQQLMGAALREESWKQIAHEQESRAEQQLAEAQRENFALAAGMCLYGLCGDEGGTPYCPRIRELESKLAASERLCAEHWTLVQELGAWLPIGSAPATGEHILVARLDNSVGFGICGGKQQFFADVAHWFFDGFYPSHFGAEPEKQLDGLTHWKSLTHDESATNELASLRLQPAEAQMERDRWRRNWTTINGNLDLAVEDRNKANALLAEAQADARRYVEVRKRFASAKTSAAERVLEGLGLAGDPAESLDAAVDIAIGATHGPRT